MKWNIITIWLTKFNTHFTILFYSFTAGGEKYNMDLEMFEPIVKEDSKWNLKGRNIFLVVSKKDQE